jgi:hypothetical protein
LIAFA